MTRTLTLLATPTNPTLPIPEQVNIYVSACWCLGRPYFIIISCTYVPSLSSWIYLSKLLLLLLSTSPSKEVHKPGEDHCCCARFILQVRGGKTKRERLDQMEPSTWRATGYSSRCMHILLINMRHVSLFFLNKYPNLIYEYKKLRNVFVAVLCFSLFYSVV